MGGLNRDPFLNDPCVGRLRRIYVRSPWRRQGIGAELVAVMLADARKYFHAVRLRADNAGAARLYERFGFERCETPDATHMLGFRATTGHGSSAGTGLLAPVAFGTHGRG